MQISSALIYFFSEIAIRVKLWGGGSGGLFVICLAGYLGMYDLVVIAVVFVLGEREPCQYDL